jgi:hypothetical protein
VRAKAVSGVKQFGWPRYNKNYGNEVMMTELQGQVFCYKEEKNI